jgi:hypothetical protein
MLGHHAVGLCTGPFQDAIGLASAILNHGLTVGE